MAITGRPRIFKTVKEFTDAITSYFDKVEKENEESLKATGKLKRNPNIAHMCEHMGIAKQNFYEYAKRYDDNNEPFAHAMRMATQHIEGFKLEAAALGMLREITTIFDLKNNHGYVDKMNLITNAEPEQISADDIANRIKNRKKEQGKTVDE